MLWIANREELARQSILVPYVESVAVRVFGSDSATRVRTTRLDRAPVVPPPGWIVCSDGQQMGVGLYPRVVARGSTPLRRRIEYVHCAVRLATVLGSKDGSLAVRTLGHASCPEHWSAYRIAVEGAEMLCAVSYPPPPIGREHSAVPGRAPVVRLRVRGWCAVTAENNRGVLGHYDFIRLQIEEGSGTYEIRVKGDRSMIVTKVEAERIAEPNEMLAVRLDLGEIELRLEEFLSLRSGSAIELTAEGPLKCFLRIGATTLVAGEMAVSDAKIVLRVTDVLSEDQSETSP